MKCDRYDLLTIGGVFAAIVGSITLSGTVKATNLENSSIACEHQLGGALEPVSFTLKDRVAKVRGGIKWQLFESLRRFGHLKRIELDSLGGSLRVAHTLPKLTDRIVLTGRVVSAAAMLATEAPNACVDEMTVSEIRFHAIHDVECHDDGTLTETVDARWTQQYVASVRSPLRERLLELHKEIYINIPVEEFFKTYPEKRCPIDFE